MDAKPHFEKTNKCKNAMPFGKKNSRKFLNFFLHSTKMDSHHQWSKFRMCELNKRPGDNFSRKFNIHHKTTYEERCSSFDLKSMNSLVDSRMFVEKFVSATN